MTGFKFNNLSPLYVLENDTCLVTERIGRFVSVSDGMVVDFMNNMSIMVLHDPKDLAEHRALMEEVYEEMMEEIFDDGDDDE